MKKLTYYKDTIFYLVSLLYITLFVYAALSKLIDFDNFQVQIAQSPLLSAFAGPISFSIPIIELLIAVGLGIEKFRKKALLAGLSLMVMFTVYIIIIINFSPFIPCSCGGVFEKMSWNQHLIFNIIMIIIAFVAIMVKSNNNSSFKFRVSTLLLSVSLSSIGMLALYFSSEQMMHTRNPFIRRFPHHPAILSKIIDLDFNSYYLAGVGKSEVYLGNLTAPLSVTVIDSGLLHKKRYQIVTMPPRDSFFNLKLNVLEPNFYLSDGQLPMVYQGTVNDWKAKIWTKNTAYFNAFEPISTSKAIFRAISSKDHNHVLGSFSVKDTTTLVHLQSILGSKKEGVFSTSGDLSYNSTHKKIIYTYTYKNEYIVIDPFSFRTEIRHTIDTNSHVRIKTSHNALKDETRLASPAWIVNKMARTNKDYIFVNSQIIGRFEDKNIWNKASIIDTYNINTGAYEFSFYLTNIKDIKMSDFIVTNEKIYIICGQHLAYFDLKKGFYKN